MRIGVPRETVPGERRVALVPEVAARLVKAGHEVVVETGAGAAAGFPDAAYERAGVQVAPPGASVLDADLIAAVRRPDADEIPRLRPDGILVALLQPGQRDGYIARLAAQGTTAFAMELVPRITKAQSMDALSSQATIAGYKAVLLAAASLPRILPMLTTAAGTLAPARAFILGAGVAGLQAIATARRLGAVVSAFDVRPAAKEQVESLGAKFVAAEVVSGEAEGAGGYARELADEQQQRVLEAVGRALPEMDLVVTTAQVPGKPAPRLITAAMVGTMRPGSVIVDLAAETGGNCEATVPGDAVVVDGVTVMGPLNLPATVPAHASQMYARNIAAFVEYHARDGGFALDLADPITGPMCLTHAGELRPR